MLTRPLQRELVNHAGRSGGSGSGVDGGDFKTKKDL